jgi:hypothetical protein
VRECVLSSVQFDQGIGAGLKLPGSVRILSHFSFNSGPGPHSRYGLDGFFVHLLRQLHVFVLSRFKPGRCQCDLRALVSPLEPYIPGLRGCHRFVEAFSQF